MGPPAGSGTSGHSCLVHLYARTVRSAIQARDLRRAEACRRGRRCSTIDLFGPGFTVLAGAQGGRWLASAREAAERFGVRVDAHAIGAPGDWSDTAGEFGRLFGVDATGAVVVRPDGQSPSASRA
jgi:phage-related tail fiber protein